MNITVTPTRYDVSVLPEDHELYPLLTLSVEYRGAGQWSSFAGVGGGHRRSMDNTGDFAYELREDDDDRAARRFDLPTALRLAEDAAPHQRRGTGRTAAEWATEAAAAGQA